MIRSLALLAAFAATPLAHAAGPIGQVVVDCTRVEGWAQDPDDPAAFIPVHLYFDGPAGDPAATGIPLTANLTLEAGCAGDQCAHGFRGALPLSRLDNLPHPVHAYGIDAVDPNLELSLSPAVYTCPPLPIVSGVKRHIAGPAILDQWQFSTYFDLMKVADLDLAAVPVGAVVDGPPQLVVAEGTQTPVWLIDQGFRRPIADAVLAAWRFAPAAAAPMAADALAALPEGTPLAARPVLVQGSGPEVYILDEHQCAADDPYPACAQPPEPTTSGGSDSTGDQPDDTGDDTTGTGSETDASTGAATTQDDTTGSATGEPDSATATGDTTPADTGDEAGCGCRSAPPSGVWALLFALTLRRRRRA